MPRAADIGRKRSGMTYAQAARRFGVDIEEAKAYAQMVKEYNRQQSQLKKEYGYKGPVYKLPSLKALYEDQQAQARFGDARALFDYMKDEAIVKLQDTPRLAFEEKVNQYAANIIQALTNNTNSAFEESDVSKAIAQLQTMTPKQIMRFTGGRFLDSYYGRTQGLDPEAPDAEDMILALAEKWDGEA